MMITMVIMTMTIIMIMLIYDISATQSAARRWWNTEAIDLNDDHDDHSDDYLDHDDHFDDHLDHDYDFGDNLDHDDHFDDMGNMNKVKN